MAYWTQLAIAGPLVFVAGFIDAIAGGGGLITLPAFLMTGLPSHMAIGTNKFAVSLGTATSTIQYIRGKCVLFEIIPISVVFALLGSFGGAQIALYLDETILRMIMIILIPIVAVFTLVKKDFFNTEEKEPLPAKKMQILTAIVAFVIGAYDGFFGPGTGTFLMLAFVGVVHLNPVIACGNTKVVNLASNIAALITYAVNGKVFFALAIPCALCSVAGNFLGARMTMKRGVGIIKPIMLVVVTLLFLTVLKDLIVTFSAN